QFAGRPDATSGIPTSAVWGEETGHFRGDSIGLGPGAIGDHGWYANIDLGNPDSPFGPLPGGPDARIREEKNEALVDGDTSSIKFLEGPDDDFVVKPDAEAPDFIAMDSSQAYRLELTLERATEATPGDTITAIFDVTDLTTGETWTLSGTEPLFNDDGAGGQIPDGFSSEGWDYFAMRNTGADDFDLIIDNFRLEIFGSLESMGGEIDFNSDGNLDCADVDALVANIAGNTGDVAFDVTGDGNVTIDDLNQWLVDAGTEVIGAPYLLGDANLDGVVDVSDFNNWNANKFTSNAAWCSGDFNADGVVDVSDFNNWNANKFTSSTDSAAAVPEPATGLLGLFGLIGILMLRKHTS
ncbi:MAG: hypothetical protein AAF497_14320, partial [Planctomycetota bacterium]